MICIKRAFTHMNELYQIIHTYEWVVSNHFHVWMSGIKSIGMRHMNAHTDACHPQIWMNCTKYIGIHGIHCHTYEEVMVHIWMRHAKHTNASCHTFKWVVSNVTAFTVFIVTHYSLSHIWRSHGTNMNGSCQFTVFCIIPIQYGVATVSRID